MYNKSANAVVESWEAASDLSAKQFFIVTSPNASRQVALAGAGGFCYGVLQNKPAAAARSAAVQTGGIAPEVESDGSGTAIASGDWVKSDANGRAVKTTTPGDLTLGKALDASSASGTRIAVVIIRAHVP